MKNDSKTTLFYDWAKIVKKSNGSTLTIISIMKNMLENPVTRVEFNGYSFLINPQGLFDDTVSTEFEKAIYAGVASFRNYFDFKYYGDTRLDVDLCEVPANEIRSNRLIRLDKGYIHFKHEAMKNGN